MNYLIEAKDGHRARITADQAAVCEQMSDVCKENLSPNHTLYRLKGERAKCPKPLHYGGRTSPKSPIGVRF